MPTTTTTTFNQNILVRKPITHVTLATGSAEPTASSSGATSRTAPTRRSPGSRCRGSTIPGRSWPASSRGSRTASRRPLDSCGNPLPAGPTGPVQKGQPVRSGQRRHLFAREPGKGRPPQQNGDGCDVFRKCRKFAQCLPTICIRAAMSPPGAHCHGNPGDQNQPNNDPARRLWHHRYGRRLRRRFKQVQQLDQT